MTKTSIVNDCNSLPSGNFNTTDWPWYNEGSFNGQPMEDNNLNYPKITIVTPNYNYGLYLEETISHHDGYMAEGQAHPLHCNQGHYGLCAGKVRQELRAEHARDIPTASASPIRARIYRRLQSLRA